MDEILIIALASALGSAWLSEATSRGVITFLRDRVRPDPAKAKRLARLIAFVALGFVIVAALSLFLYFYADKIVAALLAAISKPSRTDRISLTLVGVATGGCSSCFANMRGSDTACSRCWSPLSALRDIHPRRRPVASHG